MFNNGRSFDTNIRGFFALSRPQAPGNFPSGMQLAACSAASIFTVMMHAYTISSQLAYSVIIAGPQPYARPNARAVSSGVTLATPCVLHCTNTVRLLNQRGRLPGYSITPAATRSQQQLHLPPYVHQQVRLCLASAPDCQDHQPLEQLLVCRQGLKQAVAIQ